MFLYHKGDTEEGRQEIDIKYGWLLESLMHLYNACCKGEQKTSLSKVVSSKLVSNFDLVFPPGTFTPLNVGLNQRQSTANQNNSEKTPIEDTERHQLISHGGKGEAGF